jgi:dTMP kinase
MEGIFVTFEGVEGCGKSTQLAMLAEWLRANGRGVVETREPGGTTLGEKIRHILQSDCGDGIFSPRAEILLFEASRAQHVEMKILPAIGSGKIVLCDRFCDSTVVYQGCARAIDGNTVRFLNEFASHGREPDMTIFQDIKIPESFRRIAGRSGEQDRIERETALFFEKVRGGYLQLARENRRFFTVDGSDGVEVIHEKIKNEFESRFFKN